MPAPAAAPFTAAITGCGMVRILRTICMPARSSGSNSCVAPVWRPLPSAPRSPPAQKARPAPVTTTTLTLGSFAIRPSASLSAEASSLFSAFSRSGRFITSTAMPSCLCSRMSAPACASCGGLLTGNSVQWALVSCSLPMRATSCASFLKCRTFSLLPVAFAPLVEGRTYTRAP